MCSRFRTRVFLLFCCSPSFLDLLFALCFVLILKISEEILGESLLDVRPRDGSSTSPSVFPPLRRGPRGILIVGSPSSGCDPD